MRACMRERERKRERGRERERERGKRSIKGAKTESPWVNAQHGEIVTTERRRLDLHLLLRRACLARFLRRLLRFPNFTHRPLKGVERLVKGARTRESARVQCVCVHACV